jgi:hypothetical protein
MYLCGHSLGYQLLASFESGPETFNPFLLVTYADLKKYVYNYWFAFPALVEKPGWEVDEKGMRPWEGDVNSRILRFVSHRYDLTI